MPLFHKYGIEREIELMYSRHVPLPSGGSLVIDSTEAVVAIDVNSGKFREHADAETTAFKTDMEAADEIPRQLRLRDLGGVIICDFIDLRYERHRRELEERLHHNFAKDRAKTKVLRMSQFGIIEITRQRMRPSLKRSIYFDCPHCKGAGLVKTPESMSLDVMRRLAIAVNDLKVVRVEMTVCPDVAFYLQNKKREQIVNLEKQFNKRVVIRSDPTVALDEARLDLFDARDVRVYLADLGMAPPGPVASLPADRVGAGRDAFARIPSAAIIASRSRKTVPIASRRRPGAWGTRRGQVRHRQRGGRTGSPRPGDGGFRIRARCSRVRARRRGGSGPKPRKSSPRKMEFELSGAVVGEIAEPPHAAVPPPQRPGEFGDDQGPHRRRRRRGRRGGRGRNKNRGEFDNGPQNRQPARPRTPRPGRDRQ